MRRLATIITAIAFTLIIIWEAHAFGEHTLLQSQRETYAFCMNAHTNTTGEADDKCGRMQADTNTEFICNNTGESCWLEVK